MVINKAAIQRDIPQFSKREKGTINCVDTLKCTYYNMALL